MAIDLSTLSTREALTAVYIGYYDRAADPAGIAFWEQVVANTSLDLVAITTDFAGQSETQAVHPFFADPSESAAGAFITTLYLNLFNREPDAEGLAFWTAELQAAVAGEEGALTVGEIITAIIEGAQSSAEGGFPDEETILNKIEVALDWTAAAEASDIDFTTNTAAQESAATIIDGVTDQQVTVNDAKAVTDEFFAEDGNNGGQIGETIDLGFGGQDPVTGQFTPLDNITGTAGADTFHAEDGALVSGDQIDGGAGRDALTVFLESNSGVISARTEAVESVYITNQQNDGSDAGDNNIGGFIGDFGDIDIEIDGGRQIGVDRWEDFDSRADLVIEDARDDDDTDGTFTGDITVAMVSTDPGNVDFAVYFDGPVNTAANDDSIFIEVIDQNNSSAFNAAAITGATTGNLTDAQLTEFSILVDGERVTVVLDTTDPDIGTAHFGPDATYIDLLTAINTAMGKTQLADGSILGDDLTAALGGTFDENIGDDNAGEATNTDVFGLQIVLTSSTGRELGDAGAGDIVVVSREDPADTAQSITNQDVVVEELIRLNVELDDVGKGSMGGDALFGAMSTGRQSGDDATSDSIGIQQFDIEVDRSSQLQTINSTNNALEVVNITNGENSGINNTTTAADEMIGDLVVRGQQNNGGNRTTDNSLPGAQPQHNDFGFSDVRVINAAAMIGALNLTAELTEETVEKYFDIQDGAPNGELDDVAFAYTMGNNNDHFLLNMSDAALNQAGTGSREDFDMTLIGGAGNDVLTTNVGSAPKFINEQGDDIHLLSSTSGAWYANSVFTNASTFTVSGGSGNDTIWTHGWGDANITDGSGLDTIYTDNSGTVPLLNFFQNIQANLLESDPIDHEIGAAWAFNTDSGSSLAAGLSVTSGTNENIILGTAGGATALSNGNVNITVSFTTYGEDADLPGTDGVYTVTASIPVSEMFITAGGDIAITEQAYNQAIKTAVNGDNALSQVLEATDGPGNSLLVYTKIDGDFTGEELDVAITNYQFNGSTLIAPATPQPAGYVTNGTSVGPDVLFADYGSVSSAESDNTINISADGEADVVVLSTNDTVGTTPVPGVNDAVDDPNTDLDGTSNEEINFADGIFGTTTIFNFQEGVAAAGNGHDVMDFLHIDFAPAVFGLVADDSIFVLAETATVNSTATEAGATYAALLAGEEAIHIAFDTADDNGGIVYHLTGVGGATDAATAVVVGEIELIGTDWTTLTVDNFA